MSRTLSCSNARVIAPCPHSGAGNLNQPVLLHFPFPSFTRGIFKHTAFDTPVLFQACASHTQSACFNGQVIPRGLFPEMERQKREAVSRTITDATPPAPRDRSRPCPSKARHSRSDDRPQTDRDGRRRYTCPAHTDRSPTTDRARACRAGSNLRRCTAPRGTARRRSTSPPILLRAAGSWSAHRSPPLPSS